MACFLTPRLTVNRFHCLVALPSWGGCLDGELLLWPRTHRVAEQGRTRCSGTMVAARIGSGVFSFSNCLLCRRSHSKPHANAVRGVAGTRMYGPWQPEPGWGGMLHRIVSPAEEESQSERAAGSLSGTVTPIRAAARARSARTRICPCRWGGRCRGRRSSSW